MKRKYTLTFGLAIAACLQMSTLQKLYAQAPANDDCAGATLVSTIAYNDLTTSYTNASTTGATRSNPNPSCITSSDNNDDIWYKFVAVTQTELLRVHSVVSGSSYTTLGYALYDGCGGTQITCNNQMGTFYGNEMLGGLTPGNTYYLRFWSQNNFTFMTFSFAVMDINPVTPGNSQGTATVLSINDPGALCISPQFYTTASATRDAPDPWCNNENDDDVWFRFTCPANGVDIYPEEGALITSGGFANLGMEIVDVTNGISQSCTANYGVGSKTSFSGITGRDYYIRIWTMGLTDRAVFSLCLQQGFNNFPVNNTCANATTLTVGSGSCSTPVTGNLYNADITLALTGNPNCTVNTTLINDIWYKAVVPASGNLIVQTSATHSAVNDLVLLAYTTTNCSAFTQIACDEDGNTAAFPSANHTRISLSARTPGETIYFRVVPRNTLNMGQFSICAFDETVGTTPSISINNISRTEGNSGSKLFDFSVTLSSPSTNTVQVKYKTADISATGGVDYVSVPVKTLLTFNPGETAKTVSITVNGDTSVESNETFKVKLSDAVNATIADNTGKGTIRNDDGALALTKADSEDISFAQKVKVQLYPNPVSDKLTISLPLNSSGYHITVTDITGRIVTTLKAGQEQKTVSVNMNALSKGIYLVKVISGSTNETFKVIKQ